MTIQSPGTALALPADTELATIFRTEGAVDPIIARIEAEARAHVPDLTTAKGRDTVKSLAYKVSRSKTALDEAGKRLNEDARAQIAVVDAARKRIRDQLDALRDEVRKPLDDWEAAEERRLNGLRDRLAALDAGRADELCAASRISDVLAEVEATEIGDDWQEYQGQAAIAKDRALTTLRRSLQIATQREADAAELERLRAEQAKRDEEERQRREAAEAERRRIEAEKTAAERAAQIEREKQEAAERAARAAEERAARERAEAEARHQREIEAARRREAEAAQRERDRMAAERRAEEEAQKRREENTRIRNRVKSEIVAAFAALPQPMTHNAMADALIAGQIPHCKVSF